MARRWQSLWVLAWCLVTAVGTRGAVEGTVEIPATGPAEPALAPFDSLLQGFLREHGIPGAALAVGRNGRLVHARGFGYADVERKQAVEPDALFRVASLSKPITGVAVLQLHERGKLRLDDPAFDFLGLAAPPANCSERDPRLGRVTIRQLLYHTGGFDRDTSDDPMFRSLEIAAALGTGPPPGPRRVIEYMTCRPLDFDPGTRDAYSNFGYCVLGRVIEKASGTGYEDYVRREVLAPLGIRRMRLGCTLPEGRADAEVRYYPRDDLRGPSVFARDAGREVPAAYGAWCLEAMDAHGGWVASAPELVRFASAFDDPQRCPILKAETIAEMFRRPEVSGYDGQGRPKDAYYACGWMVRPKGDGKANTWHNGLLDGTAALLVRRHDGLTWAVLFNSDYDAQGRHFGGLIDPLLHVAADAVREWPAGREFSSAAGTAAPSEAAR